MIQKKIKQKWKIHISLQKKFMELFQKIQENLLMLERLLQESLMVLSFKNLKKTMEKHLFVGLQKSMDIELES